MSMTKKQKEAREQNLKVLARNYPTADAWKLQNDLYRLSIACEQNAINLCNVQDWQDTREQLRDKLASIAKKHGVNIMADVTGDPRGYCLKLHLPDGSYNTWGGKEAGYGIGSVD